MQNVLARAAILVRGRLILADDLRPSPPPAANSAAGPSHTPPLSLKEIVAETERRAFSTPWSKRIGTERAPPVCWESAAVSYSTKSSSTTSTNDGCFFWAEIPHPGGFSPNGRCHGLLPTRARKHFREHFPCLSAGRRRHPVGGGCPATLRHPHCDCAWTSRGVSTRFQDGRAPCMKPVPRLSSRSSAKKESHHETASENPAWASKRPPGWPRSWQAACCSAAATGARPNRRATRTPPRRRANRAVHDGPGRRDRRGHVERP